MGAKGSSGSGIGGGATIRSTADDHEAGFHIWAVDVSGYSLLQHKVPGQDDEIDDLISCEADRSKVKRYVREIDRIRSLAGKLLIRIAITSLFSDVRWGDIEITTTPHGRPFLKKPQLPVDFNVTHDGDWVALVVITNAELQPIPTAPNTAGIDVMEIHLPHYEKSVDDFVETMDMTLTPHERAWVMEGHNSPFDIAAYPILAPKTERRLDALEVARLQRLFMLWTHKEAFTKACGVGLGFDFAHLELRFWDEARRSDGDDSIIHLDEKSAAGNIIAADLPAQYTFAAIVLPPGQFGQASERRNSSTPNKPGAGTGGPSLLVTALPRRLGSDQQFPQGSTSRPFSYLTSKEAQDAGVLSLSTMDELVKASYQRVRSSS